MKRLLITALAVGAILLAGTASVSATPPKYIIAAWSMPTFTNDHTYHWPQTLAFTTTSNDKDLNALDDLLVCEVPYQIDVYLNDETTAALLEGGFLNGPNNPPESLAPGGQGVAYIAKEGPACPTPTPEATPTPTPTPEATPTPTPTPEATPTPTPTPTPEPPCNPSVNDPPPWCDPIIVTPPPTSTVETSGREGNVAGLFIVAVFLAALALWLNPLIRKVNRF